MDLNDRIAQFENMAQADPENDMAHFSLGTAYKQAERPADAAESFIRCYSLNPAMSKAYQLAAECLLEAGETDRAVAVATEGYTSAAERGDFMPRDAMGKLLEEQGAEVPHVEVDEEKIAVGGDFVCARTGQPGTQMEKPPFKGPLGEWIRENITRETWQAWIAQGTKVINELRLDLSDEEDGATYDQHMREFLGVDEQMYEKIQSGEAAGSK